MQATQESWRHIPRAGADEEARRFWIEHMERGFALMDAMARYPVEECGERMVSIPDALGAAGVEAQFSRSRIAGEFPRIFFLRAGLIDALVGVAKDMNARGWVLKIEDGFRTRAMQLHLGRDPAVFDRIVATCLWENRGQIPARELVARRAMCLVANIPANGTHLCGAAVDISVFSRDDGSEVSRGKPYLEMSEYTPMETPFVTPQEHENRRAITAMMAARGFVAYPGEFWHYNQGDALAQMTHRTGLPGRYGPIDWDPVTGDVAPFADLLTPLTPLDVLGEALDAALDRLKAA